MRELLARLRHHPAAACQLLVASLILNLFALGSALYVIQVFNRYVSYGVSGTLAALTAGVLLAIAGEFALRRLRHRLAEEIGGDADERLATGLFGLLLTARVAALAARPAGERAELLRGAERAEAALGPATLTALADVPFSLLYLLVLTLLSAPLGLVAATFCLGSGLLAWRGQVRLAEPTRALREAAERSHGLIGLTGPGADPIRQFRATDRLITRWTEAWRRGRSLRQAVAHYQTGTAAVSQMAQALLGVAVIGVGAVLVVDGQLDLGALIGANLIASRALAPLLRLVQLGEALSGADQGLTAARRFAAVAVEPAGGKFLPAWTGRLELRGLGYGWPDAPSPLFQAISVKLEPGGVLVVTGRNGAGKTTLIRLIAGLIEPSAGQILVDGVALGQISLDWWRSQTAYVPQEPVLIEGSVRENLLAVRPEATEAELHRCLAVVGLARFVNEHPQGIDRPVGGAGLAPGLRRRLALARALVIDGPLWLLDEPSEGLDREGAEAVYALLLDLVQRGKTIVVISHDPNILRGARLLLRFDGAEPMVVQGPGAALAAGGRPVSGAG